MKRGCIEVVPEDERQRFVEMYRAGCSYKDLEKEFGVMPHNRVTKWGLTRPRSSLRWQRDWDTRKYKKWTEKESVVLVEMWRDGVCKDDIIEILKRTWSSISQQAKKICAAPDDKRACGDCRRLFRPFRGKQRKCEDCLSICKNKGTVSLDQIQGHSWIASDQ